jgi:hypothetical protein
MGQSQSSRSVIVRRQVQETEQPAPVPNGPEYTPLHKLQKLSTPAPGAGSQEEDAKVQITNNSPGHTTAMLYKLINVMSPGGASGAGGDWQLLSCAQDARAHVRHCAGTPGQQWIGAAWPDVRGAAQFTNNVLQTTKQNVVGGYLSPSHDVHVQAKLGERYISGLDRYQLHTVQ